jgi:hypothetical protein
LSNTTRKLVISVLAILAVFAAIPTPAISDQPVTATRSLVEAGFITKFPLFVRWPDPSWQNPGASFVVGVLGDTPVFAHLRQIANHTTVDGSPLIIRQVHTLDEIDRCQLLYIAASEEKRLEDILEYCREKPILTVGSGEGFARRGVHINFYLADGFVRFEINQKSCESTGLSLSFRLRDIARIVEPE